MQASLHFFFFLFSQNITNKRHLFRTSQPRAVPTTHHSSLPHDHCPYLQIPKCQSRSKMHSTGESRLGCLFRNQHLPEEKTGEPFAWGTGTIHTPSLRASRAQSSAAEGAAVPLCRIPIPSALTATWRMLPGGQELSAHPTEPLLCQEEWIVHIPDTLHAEFTTWQSKGKGINSGQSKVKDREKEQKREEGEHTQASTT